MVLNPGDDLLIEEPTYPGTLAALRPFGLQYHTVTCDKFGLNPDALQQILSNWSNDKPLPKLLYLQPNCSNPTGVSVPEDRRQKIYQLARKYDLLIIEDDPYYFLNFAEKAPPSFLSLDEDGRVLRLDSFSKVMSSGFRLGFVTGAQPFIERLTLHLQVTSMHCSSLSQMLVLTLLQSLGMEGFLKHTRNVASFYKNQCHLMLAAAGRHLSGLAEWNEPTGGMFLWIKAKHVADTSHLIYTEAVKHGVVLAPGNVFMTDSNKPSSHFRASFSNVTEEAMDTGFSRLASLLRQ